MCWGGLLAFGAVDSAFAQAKPQPSRAAAKQLKAAEEAIKGKHYDVAAAKLKEVEALPERSPYDEYLLHEMRGFLDTRDKNYAAAEKDFEALLSSSFEPQSDVPTRVRQARRVESHA